MVKKILLQKTMVIFISLFLPLFLGLCPKISMAQGHNVEGYVTDGTTGEPLPGVNVFVEGTTTGTVTDMDGQYHLEIPDSNSELVFSYVGYITERVMVEGQHIINVNLNPDLEALDEVVVVGYGTQERATLTGSVASVGGATLVESPSVNLSNSFSGRIPGLIALNRSGEPGEDFSELLIRGRSTLGDSSPLIVIDGVAGREGLNQINSNDIESVSVLKDASAAIYGAQAANGVILVTTKRGRIGKPTIRYSGNQAFLQPTRLPEFADAATYAEFLNYQMGINNQSPVYTDEDIQKFRDGTNPLTHPNTDWIAETFKNVSMQSQHTLAVSGGSENVQYFVSGNYSNQEGIFENGNHNYHVLGGRANIDVDITDNLGVSADVSVSEQNQTQPGHATYQIVEFAYRNVPTLRAFYPNGLPGAGMAQGYNPVVLATDATGYRDNKTNLYQTSVSFNYEVPQISGLGLAGRISYDKEHLDHKTWYTPWTVYTYDEDINNYIESIGGPGNPELTQRNNFQSYLNANVRLSYDVETENHRINSFVATEVAERNSNFIEAYRRDYTSRVVDQIFAGSESNMRTDGSASKFTRRNYFGRMSYGFQKKYLIDFTLRYDGSSAFPAENRWGLFPGVSAGWVLTNEAFLSELNFLDELKLRGSWGEMGNDSIEPFQFLAAYDLTRGAVLGTDRALQQGVRQGVAPNPNITWEVAKTTNLGLDAELWEGLFGLTLDVFKTRRNNILAPSSESVPDYTGLSLPDENLGIVENKGFELELSHRQITGGEFNYVIRGNISFARNKIINIDEASGTPEWQRQEGAPMGSGLYLNSIGIYRTQQEIDSTPHLSGTIVGDLQYEDVNEDGEINSLDRRRLSKTNTPEITFGTRFSMGYKNIDVSLFLQGQSRAWRYFWIPQGTFGNVLQDHAENRPGPDNPDSKYPHIYADDADVSARTSDFWLYNASFVRLKNLEVGYNLPTNFIERLGIQNLRVYVNGFNLLTFDRLKYIDPEGDQPNSNRGAFYPQNRIFNIGIDISI